MSKLERGDLGFDCQLSKNGDVRIMLNGKTVTTLSGGRANSFIKRLNTTSHSEQQKLMARMAGNYKRGNEKSSHKSMERDL